MPDIEGLVNGLLLCDDPRTREINERLLARNVPSHVMKPEFSARPQATKYSYMGIVDNAQSANVPLRNYTNYEVTTTFNPGTSAPWHGFANQVNTESSLRNQFFALQKCDQAKFVPSSAGPLYNHNTVNPQNAQVQPAEHPLLQQQITLPPFNPNACNLGSRLWNNHTKNEIMDL